jgi:HEAT repeat protein
MVLPTLQNALNSAENYNDAKAALLAAQNTGVAPLVDNVIPYLHSNEKRLQEIAISLLQDYRSELNVIAAVKLQLITEKDESIKLMLDQMLMNE